MARKRPKPKLQLLQTTLKPDLLQRLYASPEYQLHGNFSAALRAILDKYLPPRQGSQEKNAAKSLHSVAG